MPNNLTPEIREAIRGNIVTLLKTIRYWEGSPSFSEMGAIELCLDRIALLIPAPADKELWEIKGLEWNQASDGHYFADTVFGRYHIIYSLSLNGWVLAYPNDVYLPPAYETIELAQSAAAQHYREKIQAGLVKYGEK